MEWQTAFDVALGIVMLLLGWILRVVWDSQVETRRALAELEARLPGTYARRDDVQELAKRIDDRFDRLDCRFDRIEEFIRGDR